MENSIVKYTANFHLTHNCNMRCGYCYAGEKTSESMTDEVIAESIDFVVRQVQEKKANKLIGSFLGPALRSVDFDAVNVSPEMLGRLSVSLTVDIPLFNLYTKSNY
jgi:MoaA/NifB/PqqE/SkfB family radical SAM enzyme